jgi:hypothetical protein
MGGGSSDFDERCDGNHPVSCYERPEWAIAVVQKVPNEFTARALICTHGYPKEGHPDIKGCFVRTYGDDADSLQQKLPLMGYERVGCWPRGATLLRIAINGGYVMPYLDGGERRVRDDGTHMTIGYGDITADSAGGFVSMQEMQECACCGDEFPEDEMSEDWQGEAVCERCMENSYREAYTSATRRSRTGMVYEDNTVYCESDGNHYLSNSNVLDYHGVHRCQHTGDWYKAEDGDIMQVRNDSSWQHSGWVHSVYAAPRERSDLDWCSVNDITLEWGVVISEAEEGVDPCIVGFVHADDMADDMPSTVLTITDAIGMELKLNQRENWTDEAQYRLDILKEELKQATDAVRRAA